MDENQRLSAALAASSSADEPLPMVWAVIQPRWTSTLTPDEKQLAASICPPRTFMQGEHIFRLGDPAEEVCVVLQGHVKLQVGEQVVHLCGPGDIFGESFLTEVECCQADALCMSPEVTVCMISREKFLDIAAQVPKAILAFTSVLAKHNADLQLRLRDMALPVQTRVARTLIDLSRRFGTPESDGLYRLQLDVNHADIAGLASTSRATATQVIGDLRRLDLVRGTRGKYLVHVNGLEDLISGKAAEAQRAG